MFIPVWVLVFIALVFVFLIYELMKVESARRWLRECSFEYAIIIQDFCGDDEDRFDCLMDFVKQRLMYKKRSKQI